MILLIKNKISDKIGVAERLFIIVSSAELGSIVKIFFSIILLTQVLLPRDLYAMQLGGCLKSKLAVNASMTKATLHIGADHRPKLDEQDWLISSHLNPGFYSYTLDIRRTVLPEGREYPSVIRLAPDTVIISLRKFMSSTSKDADRICEDVAVIADDQPAGQLPHAVIDGYVFVSNGRSMSAPHTLADKRISQIFVDYYVDSLKRSQKFYRSLLGAEKSDIVSVLFIINDVDDAGSGCRYAGSSLPGLLLIGLRSGCLKKEQDIPEDLLHFIAHEAFHQWNFVVESEGYDVDQKSMRLMLLEGGAELAADLFLSQHKSGHGHSIEYYVNAATESCIDDAAYLHRPVVDLISGGDSQLAYPCGEVYTFLRMMSLTSEPISAFGRLWKSILSAPGSDIIGPDASLEAKFLRSGVSLEVFAKLFYMKGYLLSVAKQPDRSQGFRVAVELVREISRNDCSGTYGLYTGGGRIVIDPSLKQCHNLLAGGKPIAVDGFGLYEVPLEARRAWLAACDAASSVRVTYDGAEPSNVTCISKPKDLYLPLHLSRISQGVGRD